MVVGRDAGEVLLHGGLVTDGVEVLVEHGLLGSESLLCGRSALGSPGRAQRCLWGNSYLVVVSQQLVQEVNGLVADKALVFAGDEAVPWLLLEAA